MTPIAIDSSGHAGSPPVIMLATKHTESSGQSVSALRVDLGAHGTYVNCADNWREKFTAALIYRTILPIYGPKHSLLIDWDFNTLNRRMRLQDYIRRLLGKRFYGDPTKTDPQISFSNDSDPNVRVADRKASLAYHRAGSFQVLPAPNLIRDIELLSSR